MSKVVLTIGTKIVVTSLELYLECFLKRETPRISIS